MDAMAYFEKIKPFFEDSKYFDGHFPRFLKQFEMFEKFLKDEKIETVLDAGTGTPFTSYYFNVRDGAEVCFGMPGSRADISKDVRFMPINLNYFPILPQFDVVICTECIEHLPCNVYNVRDYLFEHVRPGGYLLLSFPLGGMNAQDYEKEWPEKYDQVSNGHIREFTEQTADEFVKPLLARADLLERHIVFTRAYGGEIMQVLLRRRA